MPYLFQVNLGPVQGFIKSARRTRDLAFGSAFLSELAKAAVRTLIKEDPSAEMIFPVKWEAQDTPNKLLAYVSGAPGALAEEIRKAVDARVKEFWDDVCHSIEKSASKELELFWSKELEALWSKEKPKAQLQVLDLVEYTWAAVAFDARDGEYDRARRLLETVMAARKNTRDFAPVSWGSDAPKSSLDGALESVIPEKIYPISWSRVERAPGDQRERLKHEYSQKMRSLRERFGAGPHEKLSGVDLLKRRGPLFFPGKGERTPAADSAPANQERTEQSFPSTSHIAALPFLRALNAGDASLRSRAETWKEAYLSACKTHSDLQGIAFTPDVLPRYYRGQNYWQEIFSLDEYDGALLFPERFPDVIGDTQALRAAHQGLQKMTQILDNFFREIHLRPSPYYALLVADGDSMGKVIDHLAKSGSAREAMGWHQKFSEALATFAGEAERIVKPASSAETDMTGGDKITPGSDGVPIYTGGDDVLALLPLHTAIQCARQLASSFRETLADFHNEEKESPTLSVGLAIVHHLHPLGDALEIARRAERQAKQIPGKNALAIIVQKRSGPPCLVKGQWNVLDTRLERHIELHQKDIIPSGMAYELRELAIRLQAGHEQSAEQELAPDYARFAALRVFQRKLAGNDAVSKAVYLYLLKRMIFKADELAKEYAGIQQMLHEKEAQARSKEELEAVDELRAILARCESLNPTSIGQLANELVVARLFAQARNLAMGKSEGVEA